MPDQKQLLCSKLHHGKRSVGKSFERFKDSFKIFLQDFLTNTQSWENTAGDNSKWHDIVPKAADTADGVRTAADEGKLRVCKARASGITYMCPVC